MAYHLKTIQSQEDIPQELQGTPIADLLEYHNLKRSFEKYNHAEILVAMCMDFRKRLRIPENFAYVVRTGGVNIRHNTFHMSYAIGVGGLSAIALIAHDECGMVDIISRKEAFVRGMVQNAGWTEAAAEEHFEKGQGENEIKDERDFVFNEAQRLSELYPKVKVVPLLYRLENHNLYLIEKN